MARSLKQKNQPQIITFAVLNALFLAVLVMGRQRVLDLVSSFTRGDWSFLGKLVALPAAITLVTGAIGWALTRSTKDFLVFWKLKHRLPSSAAFTRWGKHDPRIDMDQLVRKYGALPTDPSAQTVLWYRLYKAHESAASVEDAHGAYLRFRELTALSIVAFGLGVLGVLGFTPHDRRTCSLLLVLALEYLIFMFAARNAARHFVTNVLALESAGSAPASPQDSS